MEEKFDSHVHWFTLCKMGLTGLHDSYSSRHLYICRFLFGLSTFLLLHSCLWRALRVVLHGENRAVSVSLRWVWQLCNLPCISALFWLFSIARYVFRSPRICFWGTNYDVYCERFAYLHSISWRRARLWLELFASTVDKFLSRGIFALLHFSSETLV